MTDLLTEDQRRALLALGRPVRYPPDDTIFREGAPSHSVVVVQTGSVKITKQATDGTEITLATRGAGEVLGDEGVLTNDVRSATITTTTEVIGVDIPARILVDFVEREKLWPVMYKFAVQRRRQSDERALLLARMDVRERLATVLLELADTVGVQVDGDWVIEDAFSQQELAGSIGASRDAVAVELRKFRQEGLLTTGRRRIALHNLPELRRTATGQV
ncbi:CRP-like cAMP-binding protein [Actinocrispum wychmicini]|uniref:CRP-like cAMP-binding protein n=2 Tax=Actinocrispum wychmicini TaxID=1213861 RepID=A0A4R2K844_9PSEU|nr:CRP-like cAMP-binding protein [Actinocrispum wychmicini]